MVNKIQPQFLIQSLWQADPYSAHTPVLFAIFKSISSTFQTLVIDSNQNSLPAVMSFCFPILCPCLNVQPILQASAHLQKIFPDFPSGNLSLSLSHNLSSPHFYILILIIVFIAVCLLYIKGVCACVCSPPYHELLNDEVT